MDPASRIKQEPGIKTEYLVNNGDLLANSTPALGGSPNTKRLGSFSSPRDLTLTNGRPMKPPDNKKMYKPNLNVARNRNTDVKTASGPRVTMKTDRSKNDKNTKHKKAMLVQTSGIFSDGMAKQKGRFAKYDRSSSSKEPGESIKKPVFVRANTKVDLEEEQRFMKNLCDLDNEIDELDQKLEQDLKLPVKLENADYKIRPAEVKLEPMVERSSDPLNILETLKTGPEQQTNVFLLQLPDALPGKCDSGEKRLASGSSDEKMDSAVPSTTTETEPRHCTVRDLEEGCIGKIIRYRSGKTKLMLGEIMFDISVGMDTGFLQELVSINTNQSERSGNIINLSTIKAKLNASPDWEYLFKNST
ncbi:DNA-directed RNA polymerase III subunit RPC4 [Anopheles cruzii]|uniref:DNA-directed RNA polymerase III subunit RPC4 n=1 Tax=Anopheles cruzii TaxID=68878 RepID=UPI0022EC4658|nr:DNA-directed RNA polymerase III subunit RPC4 [Anopheles cruzii]